MRSVWDLLGAQGPTFVPGFILIAGRGDMGDVLDAFLCAAAICLGQVKLSSSCQSGHRAWYFHHNLSLHHWTHSVSGSVTHCQRTARSLSGVAPGLARPCAFRPEDTAPPSGLHQSAQPPNMCRPIAEGERWRPCLQDGRAGLEKSSARWTAADTTQGVFDSITSCNQWLECTQQCCSIEK